MSVMPYQSPFVDPANPANAAQPQPAGPQPLPSSSTGSDNPFTDVLNHVSAFNAALSPATTTQSAFAPVTAQSVMLNPDQGAGGNGGGGTGGGGTTTTPAPSPPSINSPNLVPSGGTLPQPSTPRIQPSTPPPSNPVDSTNPPPVVGPSTATTPVYSVENPPPPPDPTKMADPAYAAAYYQKFAYLNPAYANITADDVNTQRSLAISGQFAASGHPEYQDFSTWFLAGKPNGATPANPSNALQPGDPGFVMPPGMTWDPYRGLVPISQPGTTPPGGTTPPLPPTDPGTPPGGTTPPGTTPPGTTPPGTTPPSTDPTTSTPDANIQNLIDIFNSQKGQNGPDMETMLAPMFQRQSTMLQQQLEAQAALTPGRLESGGFGQNEGMALADLSGQQSATLGADQLQMAQAQMTQNTALTGLATTAGMQQYTTDINADLTKFQVNTNADLQKWLDNSDNVLKKYGIDTTDLTQRYQAQLQLQGQKYSADANVNAAALQAAATESAAAAQTAASQANAQLQYQLGLQGLGVTRENNIGNFILGLMGQGNVDINSLTGILNGMLPGTVVAKSP